MKLKMFFLCAILAMIAMPFVALAQSHQEANEVPGLELVFGGTFLLVARYFGAATYGATEWAKTRLNITGGFFAYFFAVVFDLALVASLRYGLFGGVVALLSLIGVILPVPELPGGIQPNVYYFALIIVSLMTATFKFLSNKISK